jgi:hypothetical protein
MVKTYSTYGKIRNASVFTETVAFRYSHNSSLQKKKKKKKAHTRTRRDSSVGIATRLRAGRARFRVRFPEGLGIFLFTTVSRTALGPTQPPIQWVPGALSLGVKSPGREVDHSPPSSKVKGVPVLN